MVYQKRHIDIYIPNGTRDHVIVPDIIKITFNHDIMSIDKTLSTVNNVGRALVKKKVLISKEIYTINNGDIYKIYKDFYLSKKESEEKLLQVIQPVNSLKDRTGTKKADGTTLTVIIKENGIKKTFGKWFVIPLDFDFLSILYILMDLKNI